MADLREDLELIRATLLEALAEADLSLKAQIAGQLRQVVKELAALGVVEQEKSKADDLADRRSARRIAAGHSASTSRRGQPRRSGGSDRTG